MTILIYFLTIVFGIVCFVIMKKKRYKVMPLICLIMFICFIGCGIVSYRIFICSIWGDICDAIRIYCLWFDIYFGWSK